MKNRAIHGKLYLVVMRMFQNTARWIRRTHLFQADEYICSACGTSCVRPLRVCPGCGAGMKGTKYDPSWVDEAEGLSALLDDDW